MLGGLLGSLGRFAGVAGGILGGAVLYKLGQGVFDMGREALAATGEWERLTLTMESLVAREIRTTDATLSMTDALAQAGPRAQELLGWIQRLAIASPFDLEGITTSYRQALAFGFTSDRAQDLTQVLVDMSAGMGLTSDKMQLVSYALGQINQSDKLLMQDLRQLMNAGVPVNDLLQEMGYSLADVGKEAISSADFLDVFIEKMGSDFEGAAARQATSWAGLMNTFSDLKKMGLREFFGGLFDVVQPLAVAFSEWFQEEGLARLREWGTELGNFTRGVIDFGMSLEGASPQELIDRFLSGWGNLTDKISTFIDDIDWGVVSDSLIDGINSIDWNANSAAFTDGLYGLLDSLVQAAGEVKWGELALTIGDAFMSSLAGALRDEAGEALNWDEILGTWQRNIENFPGWSAVGEYIMGQVSQSWGNLMAGINTAWGNLMGNLTTKLSELGVMGLKAGQDLINGVLGGMKSLLSSLLMAGLNIGRDLVSKIAEGITSSFARILSAVRGIISAIQGMLSNANFNINLGVNGSAGAAAGAGGSAAGLGGGNTRPPTTTNTGNQNRYAGGGILSGPLSGYQTNAMFHGTEAVVPLEGGAIPVAMRGGVGGGIVVNFVYAPAVSMASQHEARDVIAPMIADGIRTELSKRGAA